MKFLEARRIADNLTGGTPLSVLFAMSGTAEPLEVFLKAAAAQRGYQASIRFLPFNTLQQALLKTPTEAEQEIFLLLPWDLVPELDWRSGLPLERLDAETALAHAAGVLERLARRSGAGLLYLPAPLPAAFADGGLQDAFGAQLAARAALAGAHLLTADDFTLGSYFASGLPIAARALGGVAITAMGLATRPAKEPAKLLITDLDNTLWQGVIAEEGPDGIAFRPEGAGYRHFVYQTFLRRLRGEGVLLAAVTRNSPEVALEPLRSGRMAVGEADFITVVASYHAKSAQIQELARQLNLGLEAVVFVDDNPIELAEVGRELPAVQCVPFPGADDGLPGLLTDLNRRFGRRELTAEDRGRTELYRKRLEGMVPRAAGGADLQDFLRDLRMRLLLQDRSSGDRTRAVQLINKTNQFNLNGRRTSDQEVQAILSVGGRLLTASLEDRTGSHGEILAILITAEGTVTSFVLSCRVFQRRVEQAFCTWLAEQPDPPRWMHFAPTERNEPFQMFLRDPAFGPAVEGEVAWDAEGYIRAHAEDLALFELVVPTRA